MSYYVFVADETETLYSIGELADKAGVSRRTVRYYVQRGLIDPPEGRGRGSGYGAKHAGQIQRVLRLQREGLDLDTIQNAPGEELPRVKLSPFGAPELVLRVPLGEGMRLELDAGVSPPSPETLDKLAEACARILRAKK